MFFYNEENGEISEVQGPGAGVVTDSLALYLDAGDSASYSGTGTTWNDLSVNNLNATLINGPTYSTDNGGILEFRGSTDLATIDTTSLRFSSSFTVSTWIRIAAFDNSWTRVLNYWNSVSLSGWFIGRHSNTSRLEFRLQGIAPDDAVNTGALALNTWYHISAVYDSTNNIGRMYVNGVETDTGTTSGTMSNYTIGQLGVGNRPGYSENFNGDIPFVKIHSIALTSEQIVQDFNATKDRFGL